MSDEIDHIAQLQRHLYARDPDSIPKRKFGILRPVKQRVDSVWGQTTIPKAEKQYSTNTAAFKRFFIFSLVFFIIAACAAAFSFFGGAVTLSSKNVDVNVLGNAFVGGGEELPVQVEVVNKNASAITNVKITLEYPKGAVDAAGSDVTRVERVIGAVESGKTKSEAFSTVLYGEQGSTRVITAIVEYNLAGASAIFQKKEAFPIVINSSPLKLTVDGPVAVAPGQPFSLTIRNLFTGEKPLNSLLARIEYPSGFVFQSAVPAPSTGNNVWLLNSLVKGIENTIVIKGKVMGEETDEKAFRVYSGIPVSDTDSTIAVTYNSTLHQVKLGAPFIVAQIAISDQESDIAAIVRGQPVRGAVTWKNTSTATIVNPIFSLQFSGADIEAASVDAGEGSYDPLSRTITWTGENNGDIASIAPGKNGQLPFTVTPKASANGDLVATLSVSGTLQELGVNQSIPSLDSKIVRFTSRLQFAVASLFSVGAIKNTGPFPPKVNQDTTYTVTWTVQPSENALSNTQVSAVLAPGVIWSGVVAPQGEAVSYSPESRTVTWSAGSLPKAGTAGQYKIVSFQVKVRPTKSQLDSEVPLIGQSTITAFDTGANVTLNAVRSGVSTRLDTDPAYSPGDEKVLP